jgi:hypothetical protein
MLHVVNYRRRQVQSPEPFSRVIGGWVIFAGGLYANLDTGGLTADGVRVLDPGDDGHVPAALQYGVGLAVTDVSDDGGVISSCSCGVQFGTGRLQVNDGGVTLCKVCGDEAEFECAACDRPLCGEHARTTSVPGDTFCRAGVGCLENYGA